MIIEYLKKFGDTKRSTIENLLIPKLSAVLTDVKKKNKVANLLKSLKADGKITTAPGYYWRLV